MELNRDILYKNKYKLLIILLIVLLIFLLPTTFLSKPNPENPQLTLISKEISQNKGETSYFLLVEPDNLGNLKVVTDVIDYPRNNSTIFSIIQKDPKFEGTDNNPVYRGFYPKLTYLFFSDKIFSMSSNTNESYHKSVTFGGDINFNTRRFENTRLKLEEIDLLLPDKIQKENISNFKLLMYLHDSDSESSLNLYPFDSISTYVRFGFPKNSNVNIIVEVPKELKSYSIESSVFEENKETGEKNSTQLRELFDGVYGISSTSKADFEKDFTRIEIKVSRNFFSIERLSFYGIILFSFLICIYYRGRKNKNLTEYISLHLGLISIPLAIYLNYRPTIGFTIVDLIIVLIVCGTFLSLWFFSRCRTES